MADFGFVFSLPAATAVDSAHHVVRLQVDGVDTPTTREFPITATATDEFVLPEGAKASIAAAQRDKTGNLSEFGEEFKFDVVDDVAPAAPGVLGILSKRQI
jgi:hypothetical protein